MHSLQHSGTTLARQNTLQRPYGSKATTRLAATGGNLLADMGALDNQVKAAVETVQVARGVGLRQDVSQTLVSRGPVLLGATITHLASATRR